MIDFVVLTNCGTDRCEFYSLTCLLNCEFEEFLNESGYCEACKEDAEYKDAYESVIDTNAKTRCASVLWIR